MPRRLLFLALLSLPLLQGCSDDTSTTPQDAAPPPDTGACSATSPRAAPVVVSVLPDDGEKPFVDLINRAQKTIRVYCYLMGAGGILTALKSQAGSGVEVKVIFDKSQQSTNASYYNELNAAGASVLWSDPKYTHMHAKTIVGDDKEAVISTGNYSYAYSIKINRDFVAHTTDSDDVAHLIHLFDTDWQRGAPSLPCTRLLVSPINARLRLIELIKSATSTLEIESMQFADTEVRDAVAERKKAGVNVRVLMADPNWVDTNIAAAKFLSNASIPARWLADPDVHAKAVVVDEARAYLGSINLSFTSLNKNREVGLVVTDPTAVQRMSSTFEKDWTSAKSF